MKTWTRYNPLGNEEKAAVNRVLDSGVLSQYIGAWHEDFNGGTEVKAFERELAEYFEIPHAVVFNSLTSGLIAAIGSLGVQPGDEVLVTPWSMSATATAIMIWGGIPVFVDIEDERYGMDPDKISSQLNERTKGIVVANIFGQACRLDEIRNICNEHKLFLVEDVAQAPGIKKGGKYLGTWGEVGGFSLNYHKHIHTGEGGFCICHDEETALKMRLIRNHAESAVAGSPIDSLENMVGFNFRMGEMEAAIGREQLKKLPKLLVENQEKAEHILNGLQAETWLKMPTGPSHEHAYYVLPFQIVNPKLNREDFLTELGKRGVPGIVSKYVNIHRLPMYQQKTAFGQFPWKFNSDVQYTYELGSLPVAEHLNDQTFFGLLISMFDMTEEDCYWIATQLKQVYIMLMEGEEA